MDPGRSRRDYWFTGFLSRWIFAFRRLYIPPRQIQVKGNHRVNYFYPCDCTFSLFDRSPNLWILRREISREIHFENGVNLFSFVSRWWNAIEFASIAQFHSTTKFQRTDSWFKLYVCKFANGNIFIPFVSFSQREITSFSKWTVHVSF